MWWGKKPQRETIGDKHHHIGDKHHHIGDKHHHTWSLIEESFVLSGRYTFYQYAPSEVSQGPEEVHKTDHSVLQRLL